MGRPAEVLNAIAARTGIFAINFIAESSLCNGSLISSVEWMKDDRAPTILHMIDIG